MQSTEPPNVPGTKPVLSICIPTFNRSALLDVCLASVLPQLEKNQQVECVVCDNASTDETASILAKYSEKYTFRTHRNDANIGLLGNITFVASQLARGQFVWMLGDDDVLADGAVAQVIELLTNAPDIDLVAINVGYFSFEKRPSPETAMGGMKDVPQSLLRRSSQNGVVPFESTLEGPCADFTAMYSSILRQSLWADEFQTPVLVNVFTSVRTTYPHAKIIATKLPGKMVGVIQRPLVFIYEMPAAKFSWSHFHALTVVVHATSLIRLFEENGVSRHFLKPYYRYQINNRGSDLGNLIWDRTTAGGCGEALQFAWMLRRYPFGLLKIFVVSCAHPRAPWMLRWPVQRWLRWRTSRK